MNEIKITKNDIKILKFIYKSNKLNNQYWFDKVDELINNNSIKKMYEIYESGFLGAEYVIITKDNKYYRIKHSINDVNTSFAMASYKKDIKNIIRIEFEELRKLINE